MNNQKGSAIDKPVADKKDTGFAIRISIGNTLGYWMATIPPSVIDPLLAHLPKYGARSYPHALWIFPIGVVLGAVTFFVITQMQRPKRVIWNTLSFFLASTLALPLFQPEFPHGYVTSTSVLFLLLSAVTVWIHNEPIDIKYASNPKIDRTARLERVKEEILFWREGMIGVLAAFLALLVSWFSSLRAVNKQVSPDPGEQLLLNNLAAILISFTSIWLVFGPLTEAARKRREAQDLLLKIEAQSATS